MPASARVTVTLPSDLVCDIDRLDDNRSRFVLEAVRRELRRRRREQLKRSLASPHPDGRQLADVGLEEWVRTLPDEDVADLVDPEAGVPIRWVAGKGWQTEKR